jgi:hypothetical protein
MKVKSLLIIRANLFVAFRMNSWIRLLGSTDLFRVCSCDFVDRPLAKVKGMIHEITRTDTKKTLDVATAPGSDFVT